MTTLTNLKLEDFIAYTRARRTPFLLLGIFLELLHWPLKLGLVFLYLFSFLILNIGISVMAVLNPFSIAYYQLFDTIGRYGKRFRVNAPEALRNDLRAPIFYFRSFYHESIDRGNTGLFGKEPKLYEKANDDEVLALALRDIGLLVSVGNPSDKIPPLGAIRLYFKEHEWQEQVQRLAAISQFVIMQPGYTEGTEWEMHMLRDVLPPEKLIYSFLEWQRLDRASKQLEYEVFAIQFERIHQCALPKEVGNAYFLCFTKSEVNGKEEWKPHLAGLEDEKATFFNFCHLPNLVWRFHSKVLAMFLGGRLLRRMPAPALLREYSVPEVRETLRPILKQIDINLPRWRTPAFKVSVLAIILILVIAKLIILSQQS